MDRPNHREHPGSDWKPPRKGSHALSFIPHFDFILNDALAHSTVRARRRRFWRISVSATTSTQRQSSPTYPVYSPGTIWVRDLQPPDHPAHLYSLSASAQRQSCLRRLRSVDHEKERHRPRDAICVWGDGLWSKLTSSLLPILAAPSSVAGTAPQV